MNTSTKRKLLKRRKRRIRATIQGATARPRLIVSKSNTALVAQIINDKSGETILAKRVVGKNAAAAATLGQSIAEAAKSKKITTVVFDRGGYKYHGVVKAIADTARSGGLKF